MLTNAVSPKLFSAVTNEPTKGLLNLVSKAAGETATKAGGAFESVKAFFVNIGMWLKTNALSLWGTTRAFIQMNPAAALVGALAVGAATILALVKFTNIFGTKTKAEEEKKPEGEKAEGEKKAEENKAEEAKPAAEQPKAPEPKAEDKPAEQKAG